MAAVTPDQAYLDGFGDGAFSRHLGWDERTVRIASVSDGDTWASEGGRPIKDLAFVNSTTGTHRMALTLDAARTTVTLNTNGAPALNVVIVVWY